jgi:hypothetical protein
MSERIVGKVAAINSDRELVINRGSEHGVTLQDYFYIKDDPIDITDPDSGEVLGSIAPTKVVVKVREVADKFCIVRTFRTREILVEEAVEGNDHLANVLNPLGRYLQPPKPAKYETRVETLRIDPSKGEPISSNESVVSIGDVAQSLLEGETLDPATATLFR